MYWIEIVEATHHPFSSWSYFWDVGRGGGGGVVHIGKERVFEVQGSLSVSSDSACIFFLSSLCSSIGDLYWKRLRLGTICLKLGSSTG